MKASDKLRQLLAPKHARWPALLGDFGGNVESDRPNEVYARVRQAGSDSYVVGSFKVRGSLRKWPNLPVWIEEDAVTGEQYIADPDADMMAYSGASQDPGLAKLPLHAASHDWRSTADDQIQFLHPLQLYPLRTQPGTATGHVTVQGGVYYVGGKLVFKQEAEDVDLSSYYPASLTDHVMVTLDENGDVQIVTRTETNLTGTWNIPEKRFISAIVRLTAGEEITWGDEDGGDIYDLRYINQFDASVIGPGGIVQITDTALIVGSDYPGTDPAEWVFVGKSSNWYDQSYDALGMAANWDGSSFGAALVDYTTYKALEIALREEGTDTIRVVKFDGTGAPTTLLEIAQDGNITMVNGATIDGMDPSAHIAADDAHHDPVTLGSGSDSILTLSDQELTLGDVATQAELDAHEAAANPHGTDFTDLDDTPSSLSGQGGQYVAVKYDETGFEFVDGGSGGGGSVGVTWFGPSWYVDGWLADVEQPDGVRTITADEVVITNVRAHVTRIGETGSTDIDLQYWNGSAWVSLFATASKPSISAYTPGGSGSASDEGSASATPDYAILAVGTRLRIVIDALPFNLSKNLTVEIEGESEGILPVGGIVIWSGSQASIPSGFQICDGTNGTPDLRDRFVPGAGNGYSVGDTGGAASHNHSSAFGVSVEADHDHSYVRFLSNFLSGVDAIDYDSWSADGEHYHSLSGNLETVDGRSEYHALCYIMRVS